MKAIDARRKHPVTLTFLLDEAVAPQELAEQIAGKCGGDVLKPGEGILVDPAGRACVVTDETLALPYFGHQWCRVTVPRASGTSARRRRR